MRIYFFLSGTFFDLDVFRVTPILYLNLKNFKKRKKYIYNYKNKQIKVFYKFEFLIIHNTIYISNNLFKIIINYHKYIIKNV